MARLAELQEKRNKIMTDATALARKEGVTAEERTQVTAMLADVDVLEADIAVEERLAKHEEERAKESRSHKAPPRGNPGEGGSDDPKEREKRERQAWDQFVRFGRSGMQDELRSFLPERRDLGAGPVGVPAANTGGYQLVPQLFDNDLIQAQRAFGALLSEVTTTRTETGAPMRISTVNDTPNGLLEMPEMTATVEVDPAFGPANSTTEMLTTGWVKVSVQELTDSAFDIEALMKDLFGKRYARGAVQKITNGSTDGTTIQSIVAGAATGGTSASGTSIGYADFVKLYSALDPAYMDNAKFSMNSNTRGLLMGLTDTLGRPIFIPSTASGAPDTVLGRPIFINQALGNVPTVAGAGNIPVQFGDFKAGYRTRIVSGNPLNGTSSIGELQMLREDHLFMGTLEIGFLGIVRMGGNVLNPGTPALVNLVMKAS
jgi:HK97 family phage major capsid protein